LREFFLNIPFLSKESQIDDFCNLKMLPRAKRYLRLFELFAHDEPMRIVSNKEEFMQKYVSLYPPPSHYRFEEKFTVKKSMRYLPYFITVPFYKKRISIDNAAIN
jgi:hypothetical protein